MAHLVTAGLQDPEDVMEINLESWFIVVFALIYGIQTFIRGWQMYRFGKKSLFFIERVSLWLLKTVKGEEAAKKRKSELLTPTRVYQMGIYRLVVGGLTILVGIIGILGLIGLLVNS